jgi:uncharacterized protein YfaS (alpha-2-macroglobulin family)
MGLIKSRRVKNRELIAFCIDTNRTAELAVLLNASYSGRFYQPGISVESMYDPAFHANSSGRWVEIAR